MKKIIVASIISILILSVACENKSNSENGSIDISKSNDMGIDKEVLKEDNNNAEYNNEPYIVEEALKNGDIVSLHGDIKNVEKLNYFLENIKNNKEDKVRIVSITIEGDSIITDLIYKDNKLTYIYDNTRDKFGLPKIINKEFKGEDFIENEYGYFIKSENEEIFLLEKSMESLEKYHKDNEAKDSTDYVFYGIIDEINGSSALVSIKSGETILSSGDKVYIDLSKGNEKFRVGDKVKVEYTGMIRESYPMQIDTVSVTKVEN